MKVLIAALFMALLLAGCVTYYNHPTKTDQEWAADYAFCSAQGGQAGGDNQYLRDRTAHNCLVGRGWTKE